MELSYDYLQVEEYLAQTKTSKKTDRVIAKLESELEKIVAQIKKDHLNIFDARKKYEVEVKRLIRFALEDAYFLGLDYTDKALGQRQPVTVKDIQRLDQLTSEFERRFWNLVSKTEDIKEFSFAVALTYISALVSNMLIKSLNTATIANLEPIEPADFSSPIQVIFKTREDERVCPICEPLNNNVYDINDDTKPEIPDDTHPNCRCRYLVYQEGKEIAG